MSAPDTAHGQGSSHTQGHGQAPGHASPSRRRTIIRNTIIAMLVAGATLLFDETKFGQVKTDEAFDDLVKYEVKNAATSDAWSKTDVKFAVIAFGEDTYNMAPAGPAWTPRRWLTDAIRQAVRGGAKAVLIDFSMPFNVPPYEDVDGSRRDEQADWAAGLAAAVSEAAAHDVALLFPDLPQHDGDSAFLTTMREAAAKHPHVRLGSSGYLTDPRDAVVRRIQTYDRGPDGRRRPSLVVQAVLFQAYGLREGLRQVEALSAKLSDDAALKQGFEWPLPGAERPLRFAVNEPEGECVSARLRLRLVADKVAQQVGSARRIEDRGDGLVTIYDPLAATPTQAELEPRFKNRIVLIGSTDPRLGDLHRASVGQLPGVYIHANSIDTLQRGLQTMPGRWWNVVAVLAFALIAGWMFALLPPLAAAKLTAGVVLLLITYGAAPFFNRTGLFINLWAPMACLLVLEGLAEFEHWWHGRKGH